MQPKVCPDSRTNGKRYQYWKVGVITELGKHGEFQYIAIDDNPCTDKTPGFPRGSGRGHLQDGLIRVPKDQFTTAELASR